MTKNLSFKLPNGTSVSVNIPVEHETDLVELGLRAFCGTLTALANSNRDDIRRYQLISFITSIVSLSELSVKRVMFANDNEHESAQSIIDNLLASLSKDNHNIKET